jgi:hypothetical protein
MHNTQIDMQIAIKPPICHTWSRGPNMTATMQPDEERLLMDNGWLDAFPARVRGYQVTIPT